MYELKNVFDVFLPQLLLYPNPTDPLNGEAANLMMTDKEKYDETVSSALICRSENTSKNSAIWTALAPPARTARRRRRARRTPRRRRRTGRTSRMLAAS